MRMFGHKGWKPKRRLPRESRRNYSVWAWLLNADGSIFCMSYGGGRQVNSADERFVRIKIRHRPGTNRSWYGWDPDRSRNTTTSVRRQGHKNMRAGWAHEHYYVGSMAELRGEPLGNLRRKRYDDKHKRPHYG
jgi:hypothetical protein